MNQQLLESSGDRTAGLEEENERLRAENERLRAMLGLPAGELPEADVEAGRLFPEDDPLLQVDARSQAPEKIALFRTLFRGREDVYARYWCDERSGKKGYSPAARSGSGRGAKDYLPLTDEVLYRHLDPASFVGHRTCGVQRMRGVMGSRQRGSAFPPERVRIEMQQSPR